jgi:hypothetical protein
MKPPGRKTAETTSSTAQAGETRTVDETRISRMDIKQFTSVCAVAVASSFANVLALVADSAAEAVGSFDLPGNARIGSARIWSLLLLCGSALAVWLLRALVPELRPLLEASTGRRAGIASEVRVQ